jgi:hypothetical protein
LISPNHSLAPDILKLFSFKKPFDISFFAWPPFETIARNVPFVDTAECCVNRFPIVLRAMGTYANKASWFETHVALPPRPVFDREGPRRSFQRSQHQMRYR